MKGKGMWIGQGKISIRPKAGQLKRDPGSGKGEKGLGIDQNTKKKKRLNQFQRSKVTATTSLKATKKAVNMNSISPSPKILSRSQVTSTVRTELSTR